MSANHLKISTRLTLAFAFMGLMIVVIGATALIKTNTLHDEFQYVVEDQYPKITEVHQIKAAVASNELAISNMLAFRNQDSVQGRITAMGDTRKQIGALFKKLDESIASANGKAALERTRAPRAQYLALQDKFVGFIKQGLTGDAAAVLEKEMPAALGPYKEAVDGMLKFQGELMDKSIGIASAEVSSLQWAVSIAAVIALVLAVILALWIIRSITAPIRQAVGVANAVAGGDLTQSIDASGQSETALLLQALKRMQDGLVQVVARVRENSEGVATASQQIAQGNQDLSSRTESQASALQETAASMEELNSTVRQNADNASQANQLAQSASTVAVKGGEVVADVVRTMKDINDSSSKIADIIGVIDSIAFQTNILALNAAVEAARAGEQGRGFAVVASEVRSLAGRSAEAAREIKQLIGASVERVKAGTALVDKAGQTMTEVVQSIQRVTDIMGEISSASSEQSQGVSQVGEAVTQMDQVTQQNAALVEEMAAAASSLSTQAQDLVSAVSVFRLSGHQSSARASVAAPSRPAPVKAVPAPARAKASIGQAKPKLAAPKALPARATPEAAASAGKDDDWESF